MVERRSPKPDVGGSSPSWPATSKPTHQSSQRIIPKRFQSRTFCRQNYRHLVLRAVSFPASAISHVWNLFIAGSTASRRVEKWRFFNMLSSPIVDNSPIFRRKQAKRPLGRHGYSSFSPSFFQMGESRSGESRWKLRAGRFAVGSPLEEK